MNDLPELADLTGISIPELKETAEGTTVSTAGIRRLARDLHRTERSLMAAFLQQDIWPERFRRCRGSLTAAELSRLLFTRVLIAGCGGLGGHVAELLVRTGTGSLVLCDPDTFEESNLNRQRFCTEKNLGRFKAEACRDGLLDIASYLDIEVRTVALDENSLPGLLTDVDVVMDCLDSIERKKMLELAALKAGIPCVQGAVARNEGIALFDRCQPFSHLYPGGTAGNLEGDPMDTHVLTVAGTACLMVSLLMRRLCQNKDDSGKLFHLDLSVPELETLSLSPLS